MKEYIEREALLNLIEENSETKFDWSESVDTDILRPAILDMPAADVAPIIHGQWIGIEGDVCSECGASLSEIMDADSYYAIGFEPKQLVACPFCGARMDGGNE